MMDTEYASQCCGNCCYVDDTSPSLRCARSRISPLIVDAFFVCPLWRERMGKEQE